jgi:hypothetical protein
LSFRPYEVTHVVERCLQSEPEDRWPSITVSSGGSKRLYDARVAETEIVIVSGAELDLAAGLYGQRPIAVKLRIATPALPAASRCAGEAWVR